MKTYVSPALLAHMAGPSSTLAWCWIVRRLDGVLFAFTSHVADLRIKSVLLPPGVETIVCKGAGGFLATDIAKTDTMAQDNFDIQGVLDDDAITEVDLRAGLWKNAALEICVVNYNDLSMGTNTQFVGSIGNINAGALAFKAEQRGLTQALEANLDGMVSDQCDAKLGDRRCGKDISSFIRTGTVGTRVDDRVFIDVARTEEDGWWTKGELQMTSGASMKLPPMEVKRSLDDGTIELAEEMFFGIAQGDTYSISPGCDKLIDSDCLFKYDNTRRFRAYPFVPGTDKINQYGGQDAS